MMFRLSSTIAAFGCLAMGIASADPAPLVAQKPVVIPGGPGAFDFMAVDAPMHHVFATHKGTKTAAVVDLQTDTALPSPEVGTAQGVAVDTADNKIYFGDEEEQKVVAVDRKTLAKVAEIAVTGPVDDVAYDPKNNMIYADHDDGTEVWVIDPKTDKLVGTVTVAGAPEYVEYDAKTDRLYQNIKVTNTVQVIDPAKNTVEASWSTEPATSPHGLAIDHKTQRVFTAGSNGKLAVIDIKTGKVIASADIAKGVDQIAFDPSNRRIYCACSGAISVVQETAKGVKSLGDVPSHRGAHTITVDPGTHAVWICYSDDHDSYLQKYTLP